ncbi:MAG: phosphodiester glycosidase family protein [Clostridia bacterium]|nr:phosphodiester glycosidase family protein [Clostridia bacterium]
MKTAEKEFRKSNYSNRPHNGHNQKKKKKSKLKCIIKALLCMGILGIAIVLFLLYGPFKGFRTWYITSAMTTMHHQYLATWFYSAETIQEVLDSNKVIEVSGTTDTSQINTNKTEDDSKKTYANEYEKAVLEKDKNHPDYKIIDIKGKGYSGYLAVVYDPSQIKAMVTSKLDVSGQYVTTMAENNKAVLAINGGGFEDLNHNSTGGSPLGLTFVNGKMVTNKSYGGAGGLIGFDEDNKLVIGKMTAAEAKNKKIRDAVTCGPFLIMNGEASKVLGNGGWGLAPRTAIGQRKDGIVLMLVVDGRQVGKQGADMDDLIEIMQRYGAYNASALDGGTSSVMVENYKIINDPIDSTGAHKTRPIATAFGVITGKK